MTTIWGGPIPSRVGLGREGCRWKLSVFTANSQMFYTKYHRIRRCPAFPGSPAASRLTYEPSLLRYFPWLMPSRITNLGEQSSKP